MMSFVDWPAVMGQVLSFKENTKYAYRYYFSKEYILAKKWLYELVPPRIKYIQRVLPNIFEGGTRDQGKVNAGVLQPGNKRLLPILTILQVLFVPKYPKRRYLIR